MKIESLETQNKELQSDLKVMEQDRLHWWQQQVCRWGGGVNLTHVWTW